VGKKQQKKYESGVTFFNSVGKKNKLGAFYKSGGDSKQIIVNYVHGNIPGCGDPDFKPSWYHFNH